MLTTMTPRPDTEQTPVRALAALHAAQRRWERTKSAHAAEDAARDEAVASARQAGVRWEDVAAAVKMAQPHAVRKWRPRLVEERTITLTPRRGRAS